MYHCYNIPPYRFANGVFINLIENIYTVLSYHNPRGRLRD